MSPIALPKPSTKFSQQGIRRVVTGHDERGEPIIDKDDQTALLDVTPEHALFSVVWSTDSNPANNMDERDGALKPVWSGSSHNTNGGSVLRYVDFPPHCTSPMHRTQTLDYGIVLSGEIVLELSTGEETTLKAHDTCVQRGTDHRWHNRTNDWCRVVYILLDAAPLFIAGKELGNSGFPENFEHGEH